jgi:chromosome segregation ATPase
MDIKQVIADLGVKRGRAVAKSDPIYDGRRDARDAEVAMATAKNPKEFDKKKKECLAGVEAGEKAVKPWQKEMDDWEQAIADLEKEIKAGEDVIAEKVREADAVNKAIDEVNAKIKKHNDDLILGERDPRAQPYVEKSNAISKLTDATKAIVEATTLAKAERETFKNQKEWVAKPIDELKEIKGRAPKAKFKPPK